jgi:type II secretory pathway component PulF
MYQQNDQAGSQTEAEIKEWAFGIRCVFVVINILPLYFCSHALLSAPKFAQIFEDMLGSRQKLPILTNLVLEWSLPLLALVWLLAALAVFMIFTLKRARHVWITAAVSSFVFIVAGYLVTTALFLPLTGVIQSLSGGTVAP